MHRRRDRLLQLWQDLLDRIDHLDRVGPRLALDRQPFGRFALEPGALTIVSHPVDNIGDVAETNGRAVAIGDDHVAEAGGVENLVVGVERDGLMRAFEIAFRAIYRRQRQGIAHVFETDPSRCQRARIDLNMHRVRLLPEDAGFGDAFHSRELLGDDRVGIIVDAVDRHRVGMDRIDQHRPVGRVRLAVCRRTRQVLGQQARCGVDRLLHVLRRAVDVALQIELQRDQRRADAAGRGHLGQARQRGELLLERRRHRRGHRVRAGARVVDRYRDRREIDFRQSGNRQKVISADAENQNAEHQQRRRDRPPDKRFGNAHRRLLWQRGRERDDAVFGFIRPLPRGRWP